MGKLSPNDYKAIGWYAQKHGLRLTLSTPPFIFFRTAEGQNVERSLLSIRTQYESWRKQELKKEKEV